MGGGAFFRGPWILSEDAVGGVVSIRAARRSARAEERMQAREAGKRFACGQGVVAAGLAGVGDEGA